MEVTNELVADSFLWEHTQIPLTERVDDMEKLDSIIKYCRDLGEEMHCDSDLYEEEVEPETTLNELLYGFKRPASVDGQVFLREMFLKNKFAYDVPENENVILCSCGEYENAASDLKEYAKHRQIYLKQMKNPQEYAGFMKSCFPNSVFSNDCGQELTYIKDFEMYVEEITDCISVLDENAVEVFTENSKNPELAMRILQEMLGRTCAPDPHHKKQLQFEFSYDEKLGREIVKRKKLVVCHPHFKLINDYSNLRVYFQWKDSDVGDGRKVLIGHIGGHLWKK